ncbi:hypothetical protein FRC00_000824 [Tulasnella sp. 408]|nr:hypothetical protein FRC00_000824 [Tulasnella sp. 408]
MNATAQNLPNAPIFEVPDPVDEFGQDGGKFYRCYDALADEIDDDMVKGLKEQLDGMLIFAGLFAGVNSAFLALTLPLLSADPSDDISALLAQNNAILIQMATGRNDTVSTNARLPSAEFSPSRDIFAVNALFSLSLAFAIISSFLAVLGRQWLVYYRKRSGGGPDRQRWEQLKRFLGAERWQLEPILDDVLPSLLQIGLIIFCASLILYLRHLSPAISWIVGIPIARAIPPAVKGIKALEWEKLRQEFSIKRWVHTLSQGREGESPESLQVIALQRAICTSDDPATLLRATANIFGITKVSQMEQLWSDRGFQERFLDQFQNSYSRMLQLRGHNQVNIAVSSRRLYSSAAAHIVMYRDTKWDIHEPLERAGREDLVRVVGRALAELAGPNFWNWVGCDSLALGLLSCIENMFSAESPQEKLTAEQQFSLLKNSEQIMQTLRLQGVPWHAIRKLRFRASQMWQEEFAVAAHGGM